MRRKINLIKSGRRFADKLSVYIKARNTLVFTFLFFLLTNFFIYYFLSQQNKNVSDLSRKKAELVQFFIDNKEAEAEFIYFSNKQRQFTRLLKDDVNFYPYYNLLKASLEKFSFFVKLDSVFIDKDKTTSFAISFDNYNNLINFLKFAESEDFLENFDQLSLINFSTADARTSRKEYRLNFEGRFRVL
ncbi:hypothetical protein A2774_01325 [Candidatus Roizmanbacteria bacterium RIFCSPHIGHO2_01_FULL_39_12c]|uniref:Uncharacterized protein n=1 Tax=Candidatus Roizmanbacteria bacterium RIFCSPHIGHO2_01_FULL_39_12c TaxID=1802031 RepID=A0A1F7GDM0_9BACT|nr:MAG: hypothetical protein A2774_01325 [Candidatus Roizmanbacteria bacterium RIFCSPHIGHO2_01_FULL_39_12c]OGK47515.1 MAG: hypothetical protein A2963_01330 [Candidatus Roizmanbacteria bacterium RIFCSPLOWO2_01_FULL_40_13]